MSVKSISITLISAVIVVVISYAVFLVYVSWPIESLSITNAGIFGDSFGIITSLFSGLAFTGMIVTILLQKEELSLQRNELSLTRKEFIEQKKIFRIQSFNDSFYRLLDFRKKCLSEITIISDKANNTKKHSIDALKHLIDNFNESYDTTEFKGYGNSKGDKKLILQYKIGLAIHDKIVTNRQGRYLGVLRSLFSLIDSELNSDEEKSMYWSLLADQMTAHEKIYLFLVIFYSNVDKELHDYVHHAKFFENQPAGLGLLVALRLMYEERYSTKLPNLKLNKYMPFTKKESTRIKNIIKNEHKQLNSDKTVTTKQESTF